MVFNESVLKVISTGMKARVAEFFLSNPPKMSEREIARQLKISHMSLNRAVNELFCINFLKATRAGNVNLWELNTGSYSYEIISSVINKMPGAAQPVKDLIKNIKSCLKSDKIITSYLYGSVASGQEKPDSDIDLLIVVKDEEAINEIEPLLERLEKRCLLLYGNPLSPYILTQKEFMAKKGLPVIKNAMKGIKII